MDVEEIHAILKLWAISQSYRKLYAMLNGDLNPMDFLVEVKARAESILEKEEKELNNILKVEEPQDNFLKANRNTEIAMHNETIERMKWVLLEEKFR